MKKIVVVVFVAAAALAGCGSEEAKEIAPVGGVNYTRLCIEGVSYLAVSCGVTVEYTAGGGIKTY